MLPLLAIVFMYPHTCANSMLDSVAMVSDGVWTELRPWSDSAGKSVESVLLPVGVRDHVPERSLPVRFL